MKKRLLVLITVSMLSLSVLSGCTQAIDAIKGVPIPNVEVPGITEPNNEAPAKNNGAGEENVGSPTEDNGTNNQNNGAGEDNSGNQESEDDDDSSEGND